MTTSSRLAFTLWDEMSKTANLPNNDNLQRIEAFFGIQVVSSVILAQPTLVAGVDDGKLWIIPSGTKTGAVWAASAVTGMIAQAQADATWKFYTPPANSYLQAFDFATKHTLYWDGTAWVLDKTNAILSATLAATTSNYAGTGYLTCSIMRFTLTGAQILTGIAGGLADRRLVITNVDTTDSLTMTHDATSTAANRFLCPGNRNFILGPGNSVELFYDGTSSRWRVMKPFGEDLLAMGNVSGAINIDLSYKNISLTLTGNATITFTNPPVAGHVSECTIEVTQGGAGTYTLTQAASGVWPGSVAHVLTTGVGKRDDIMYRVRSTGAYTGYPFANVG